MAAKKKNPIMTPLMTPVRRRRRWRSSYSRRKRVMGGFSELFAMAMLKLEEHGKKPEEVLWVGSHDGSLRGSWEDFKAIKQSIMAADLVVAGDGWWLIRQSKYVAGRNSQEWRFIEPPIYMPEAKPLAAWKERRKR